MYNRVLSSPLFRSSIERKPWRLQEKSKMCSSVAPRLWFLTDRRIREDYPQQEILRALKAKCCEEELDFRALVMDEVVLTIEDGNLGENQLRLGICWKDIWENTVKWSIYTLYNEFHACHTTIRNLNHVDVHGIMLFIIYCDNQI